jgi:two-component system KDP operon response regulator KdpE
MDERRKILIVDDESQISRVLRHILAAHDYAVRSADDGEAALKVFHEWSPAAVLTDLQMPKMDGLELCRRLRAVSDIPIIVLSVRNEEKTIVEALEAGADDYVTKPFGTNELIARIRSALRRAPERTSESIVSGDFVVDIARHTAEVAGSELRLTPKEFELLACFLRHPDRVLTHSFLLKSVWGEYYTEQSEALRVLVGSLRKKIEPDPAAPKYLQTEPWVGYRFKSS